MEEEKEGVKTTVDETTIPIAPTEKEKNDQSTVDETTQKNEIEDSEQETLSKKELEDLRKRASDYDKMVQTKRGQKLLDKMKPSNTEGEFEENTPVFDVEEFKAETIKAAEEAALRIVDSNNQEKRRENVTSAYDSWIEENSWASDDSVFNEIFKQIQPINSTKKEDLLAELDRAALTANPSLYKQNMENKIRSKILVENNKIDAGSAGGNGTSVRKEEIDIPITKQDQTIIDKYFGGDKERYLKTKQK